MSVRTFRKATLGAGLALCLWAPVQAETAGPYLAARSAAQHSDFAAAARYFDEALRDDPSNPAFLEGALQAHVATGAFDAALPLARRLAAGAGATPVTRLVETVEAARAGDWTAILAAPDAGTGTAPLIDALTRAWALLGAGETAQALDRFDALSRTTGLRSLALYHEVLARSAAGDFAGAEAILGQSGDDSLPRSREVIRLEAQILAELGRADEAARLIRSEPGAVRDPELADLLGALETGRFAGFDVIASPAEGIAAACLTIARAMETKAPETYGLLFTRAAERLAPANVEATFASARLLERIERFDLAAAAYDTVPPGDPRHTEAELRRADALRAMGDLGRAVEVLSDLAATYPTSVPVQTRLGDVLRSADRLAEARNAYHRALGHAPLETDRWILHYARATTAYGLGDWPAAEFDLRAALGLQPGQPQVQNFLGYAIIEEGGNLDEALALIRAAAEALPDSGAVADSLGWALYQMGRTKEAVQQLEKASELEPMNPVIVDHLGDAYWAVGRRAEAEFQWERALSFDPAAADAAAIRSKLFQGRLSAQDKQGEPAIDVAHDEGR